MTELDDRLARLRGAGPPFAAPPIDEVRARGQHLARRRRTARGLAALAVLLLLGTGITVFVATRPDQQTVTVVTPPDGSLQEQVAQYARWHVVAQQRTLRPDVAAVARYRQQHLANYGGVWFDNGPKVHLIVRVGGDLNRHRAALRKAVPHPDLLEVLPLLQSGHQAQQLADRLQKELGRRADVIGPLPAEAQARYPGPTTPLVALGPSQLALAQRLYRTYGDRLWVRVGVLTYPMARAGFVPFAGNEPQATDNFASAEPLQAPCDWRRQLGLPSRRLPSAPASLPTTLRGIAPQPNDAVATAQITVVNRTGRIYRMSSDNWGYLVDPATGNPVTTFEMGRISHLNLPSSPTAAPGERTTAGVTIAAYPCSYALGYRLREGRYLLYAALPDPGDPGRPGSSIRMVYARHPVTVSYAGNGAMQLDFGPDSADSVANYERWDVVGQQQAMKPYLDALLAYEKAHRDADLTVTFHNGPQVLLFVEAAKGHLRSVTKLLRSIQRQIETAQGHPDPGYGNTFWSVGPQEHGVREMRALTTRVKRELGSLAATRGTAGVIPGLHSVSVSLPADRLDLAERLEREYGDRVDLRVGSLPYPMVKAPFVDVFWPSGYGGLQRTWLSGSCGQTAPAPYLPAGIEVAVSTAVRKDDFYRELSFVARIGNRGVSAFEASPPAVVFVVDPRTGHVVAMTSSMDSSVQPAIAPGGSGTVAGAATWQGCSYEGGYLLRPGEYELRAEIGIDSSVLPKGPLPPSERGKPLKIPASARAVISAPVTLR